MTSVLTAPDAAVRRRWVPRIAALGTAGVVAYVTCWAVAGLWWSGYDPASQAISELFARGAPAGPARMMAGVLVVTGLLLPPFAWALHHGLPGTSPVAPVLAAVSGICTVAIVAFPCSSACPGAGTSVTDTVHTIVAGGGYAALVAVPLVFARRLRGHDEALRRASLVLGGVAAGGFVVYVLGLVDAVVGLQQRAFNTTADLWYVVAGIAVLRRSSASGVDP